MPKTTPQTSRRSRSSMRDTHRQYALGEAKQQNPRGVRVDFHRVKSLVNRKFRTKYSIYQISALLGNYGFLNSKPAPSKTKKN